MDPKEYEARLAAIEQMVETLVRGYRRGYHFQILGGLEKTAQEHDRFATAPMATAAADPSMRMPVVIAKVAVE